MVEDALSFWTEIQRYEDLLAADAKALCFAPLSELYRKLGLLDDAISVAQKGCALHPDYAIGFLALGSACYAKGQTAEARQALERVVAIKPDHLQALKLLGQVYVEQNDIARARQALGQVLERDPDDLECTLLMNSIGTATPAAEPEEVLEEVELIEELEEVFDEFSSEEIPVAAAAPQPSPAAAPAGRAVKAEEDEFAIEDLGGAESAPQAEPPRKQTVPDPLATATLAELYVSQGFLGKAVAIYREILQAHPDNQQYRLRCAEIVEMQELQENPVAQAPAPAAAEEDDFSFDLEESSPDEEELAVGAEEFAIGDEELVVGDEELVVVEDELSAGEDALAAAFDLEEIPVLEGGIDLEAPVAMEVPIAVEIPAPAPAELDFESPAELETAALEAAAPEAAGEPGGEGGVVAELSRWLENIRRRRDGI